MRMVTREEAFEEFFQEIAVQLWRMEREGKLTPPPRTRAESGPGSSESPEEQ